MQEAEIDNTSDRIKKRRRSTESGTDNISALVPRQVRSCTVQSIVYVDVCKKGERILLCHCGTILAVMYSTLYSYFDNLMTVSSLNSWRVG